MRAQQRVSTADPGAVLAASVLDAAVAASPSWTTGAAQAPRPRNRWRSHGRRDRLDRDRWRSPRRRDRRDSRTPLAGAVGTPPAP
jgi:hypothetical protein